MIEPKLRFKADDGSQFPDWEEKKIDDIGCFIKGAGLSKADISNVGTPLILYGELYTTYSEVAYTVLNMKLLIPCLAEQQKIADCLSSLDEVIEK